MSIVIKEIKENDKKGKKLFVQYPIQLYKNCPYYVPSLNFEELETLNEKKNPAFEVCEKKMFLAYRDNKIVGRICAIINHKANEIWNTRNGRFSFCDFIDDEEVVNALFEVAENWIRSKGMTGIVGPAGFSGLDHEALLIEGFDYVTTMASKYNFPYYQKHIERIGFEKEVDANEYIITIPKIIPERNTRIANLVTNRYNITILKVKSMKQVRPYVEKVFRLLNKAYAPLYGFVPLTDRQINYYVKNYVPLLRWELVTILLDEHDEVIAFGIIMPSLSKALIKCQGKLFPFGWTHLLKAMKCKNKMADLLLIGIDPEHQGKGLNAVIFSDLIPRLREEGFEHAETNPELEVNGKVNSLWDEYENIQHKKRRFYKKELS